MDQAAPEYRVGGKQTAELEEAAADPVTLPVFERAVFLLEKIERVAVHDLGGALEKLAGDGEEGAGEIKIVAVEPAHHVTGGAIEALVDGIALAAVPDGLRMGEEGRVAGDDPRRAVLGTTVVHDELKIWIILQDDRAQTFLDERRLLVAGHHNGKAGPDDGGGVRGRDCFHRPRPAGAPRRGGGQFTQEARKGHANSRGWT